MKSARQIELERLYDISVGSRGIVDSFDLLYACLRNIDPSYFYREDRDPIEKLLTDSFKSAAILLHRMVGEASELNDICKQRICGAVDLYLRKICHMDEKAMAEFRSSAAFDPWAFSIFDGLE